METNKRRVQDPGVESGERPYHNIFGSRGPLPTPHSGPGYGPPLEEPVDAIGKALNSIIVDAMAISCRALTLLNQLALGPDLLTTNQRSRADELAAEFDKAKIETIWGKVA